MSSASTDPSASLGIGRGGHSESTILLLYALPWAKRTGWPRSRPWRRSSWWTQWLRRQMRPWWPRNPRSWCSGQSFSSYLNAASQPALRWTTPRGHHSAECYYYYLSRCAPNTTPSSGPSMERVHPPTSNNTAGTERGPVLNPTGILNVGALSPEIQFQINKAVTQALA